MLNENLEKYFYPGEIVCVDESLISFRGRIIYKQYIKQKRYQNIQILFKTGIHNHLQNLLREKNGYGENNAY